MLSLLTGMPVLILCLLLQASFVTMSMRYYVRAKAQGRIESSWFQFSILSTVMLLTLLGNFVQMAIWALLFRVLGEFDDFATALYHSGVNFTTLGYGDMVLSDRWRLLGPLEAANGILMFGVSTAVMTAAIIDVIKYKHAKQPGDTDTAADVESRK